MDKDAIITEKILPNLVQCRHKYLQLEHNCISKTKLKGSTQGNIQIAACNCFEIVVAAFVKNGSTK
jgi:hypothetical protein